MTDEEAHIELAHALAVIQLADYRLRIGSYLWQVDQLVMEKRRAVLVQELLAQAPALPTLETPTLETPKLETPTPRPL